MSENQSFEVILALLSQHKVFVLKKLSAEAMNTIMKIMAMHERKT